MSQCSICPPQATTSLAFWSRLVTLVKLWVPSVGELWGPEVGSPGQGEPQAVQPRMSCWELSMQFTVLAGEYGINRTGRAVWIFSQRDFPYSLNRITDSFSVTFKIIKSSPSSTAKAMCPQCPFYTSINPDGDGDCLCQGLRTLWVQKLFLTSKLSLCRLPCECGSR